MKECSKCHQLKSLTEFTKDKLQKSGLRPDCKSCCYRDRHISYLKHCSKYKAKYFTNQETLKQKQINYYYNHIQERKIYNKIYLKNRRQTDIKFQIRGNLARRILLALQNNQKTGTTIKLLGCSIDNLKKHLESKFQEGMSWNNYGKQGWVIDHVIPCCAFNLLDVQEQQKYFHYSNLQPLWAKDNAKKISLDKKHVR